MNRYRSADGEERLWFDDDEIERIMEDELRNAKLFPTRQASAVDIEQFIEGYLKASLDQYAELDDDVLGLTEFHPSRPPAVQINKNLTGSAMDDEWCPPGIVGRWRATLAHEAAHVVLHRMLFDLDLNQMELFDVPAPTKGPLLFRCLKRDVVHGGRTSDWREVQANKGMAALLMPKMAFTRAARGLVGDRNSAAVDLAARNLAAQFEVSREAAMIRLRTLGFIADQDGLDL